MRKSNHDLCEKHMIGRYTREWLISGETCPPLLGHGINLCGVSDAADGFSFVRRRPPMAQLLACVAGEGRVLVGERWLRCSAGEAYVTPPGVLHAYRAVARRRWRLAWAHLGVLEVGGPARVVVDATALESAVDGLYRESIGPADATTMHTWATLVALLCRRAVGKLRFEPRLQELWRQVDARLSYPWNCRVLAAEVGLSTEHLRRLCAAQVGTSPMRYVTTLRMRRADSLLRTGAFRVEAVARLAGYSDAFAFSVAFRRHFGTSPSRVIPPE